MSRRAGGLLEPTGLRAGDHICWTYSSDEDHRRVLTAFVAEGLQAGERVAYFAPRGGEHRLIGYLASVGVDVASLITEGRLIVGGAEGSYSPNGTFDADASLRGFRSMAGQAVSDGYTGLRVAGENGWILADPRYHFHWPSYEVRVDRMISELPLIGMCSFDLRECGGEIMTLMDAVHPLQLGVPAGEAMFHLHADRSSGVVLDGELDFANSATVRSLFEALSHDDPVRRIDLSGLSFADVNAMKAIAEGVGAMTAAGETVRVEGAPSWFTR
ncbi:MAG TPA: MEDS domain-containing protein, partial [Actinomycetota bacterium]